MRKSSLLERLCRIGRCKRRRCLPTEGDRARAPLSGGADNGPGCRGNDHGGAATALRLKEEGDAFSALLAGKDEGPNGLPDEDKSTSAKWSAVTGGRGGRALVDAELSRLVRAGTHDDDFAAALALLRDAGNTEDGSCHHGPPCKCGFHIARGQVYLNRAALALAASRPLTPHQLDALVAACPEPAASRLALERWLGGNRALFGDARAGACRVAEGAYDHCNHDIRVRQWVARRVQLTAGRTGRSCGRWRCCRWRPSALAQLRAALDVVFDDSRPVAAPGDLDYLGCRSTYTCPTELAVRGASERIYALEHGAHVDALKTSLVLWALERASCRGRADACLFSRAEAVALGADCSLSRLRLCAADAERLRDLRARLFPGVPLLACLWNADHCGEDEFAPPGPARPHHCVRLRCRVRAVRDAPIWTYESGEIAASVEQLTLDLGAGAPVIRAPSYPVFELSLDAHAGALASSLYPPLYALVPDRDHTGVGAQCGDHGYVVPDGRVVPVVGDACVAISDNLDDTTVSDNRDDACGESGPDARNTVIPAEPLRPRVYCSFKLTRGASGAVGLDAEHFSERDICDWRGCRHGCLELDPRWRYLPSPEWTVWTQICADAARLPRAIAPLLLHYAGIELAALPAL